MTIEYTPWTLFTDIGIVAGLLLVGKFLRVKLPILQKMFIPASLIAGFLGLLLGPNGIGILPLSNNTGTYAGILIALVFSCLAFSSSGNRKIDGDIGRMWAYSQAGMLLQWLFACILGIYLLHLLWPSFKIYYSISMPTGFCGGHGTAAAIGEAFRNMNDEKMLTLAMTSATFGIIASVVLGLLIIKLATKKGYTTYLTDFERLPKELRTGILPLDRFESMGKSTFSSISIDSLTINVSVIMIIALGGYIFSNLVSSFYPQLKLPVFSCAFVFGIICLFFIKKMGVEQYLCRTTISHLSGAFTDFLVVCGVASIQLSVVIEYAIPLIILLVSGLLVTFIYVFVTSRYIFKEAWFENAIFTWGWYTGTMAMGIALLRVVDPNMKSRCLENYALAYLFIAPVEIGLVTFAPLAFFSGNVISLIGFCFLFLLVLLTICFYKHWFKK